MTDLAIWMHTESIGRLYGPKSKQHSHCLIKKMSVNGASTIFGPGSYVMIQRLGHFDAY
jgi:hypothetical protein